MIEPYISVVMNTYNGNQNWLFEAVNSYLKQRSVRLQLIISTVKGDPSLETLKGFPVDFVISEKPCIYAQLNKALKAIKGDWYAYASGDDVALSNKLILEYEMAIKYNAKVVYSGYFKVNMRLYNRQEIIFRDFDINALFSGCYISDCALISRDVIDRYGPFDLECGNLAYYDFWFRVYEGEGNVFVSHKQGTWLYRQHPYQNKRKCHNNPDIKKEKLRLIEMVRTKHLSLKK